MNELLRILDNAAANGDDLNTGPMRAIVRMLVAHYQTAIETLQTIALEDLG